MEVRVVLPRDTTPKSTVQSLPFSQTRPTPIRGPGPRNCVPCRKVIAVIGDGAITGGMAVGDSLVQQMLGHGIAAKLSQRLGEGVLNGLLTARLGLAAIDVTRPLPFTALPRPALGDLAKDLLRKRDGEE